MKIGGDDEEAEILNHHKKVLTVDMVNEGIKVSYVC